MEVGDHGAVVRIHAVDVAVVVGENPPVVLLDLAVVGLGTPLVFAVDPVDVAVVVGDDLLVVLFDLAVVGVDLAFQLGLSLALSGLHLAFESRCVESVGHGVAPDQISATMPGAAEVWSFPDSAFWRSRGC